MAEETVSKRGRPVGTRTATVELDTLSFKVPVELKARLQTYAKQRRHSISELIREGVEWRIGEDDPLSYRYGTAASGETMSFFMACYPRWRRRLDSYENLCRL